MKHLLRCVWISLLAVAGGCGTLTGREGENGALPVETYKSVNGDLYLLGMRPGPSGSGNPGTVVCWFSVVCPVLAVVSLPLDALIDTLLLPADLRAAREPENAL
ncbi:YceK/YidQ family lipoprotein [Ectopseudomonas khazarica]|uniref:YceK/YidQ family lipoprotein n=1 Tax=Ectopseudomonas khazarica TaxID=2502979 RepID=UPI003A93864E